MNKENIERILQSTEADVSIAASISDNIISGYTSTLDEIMRDIKTNIIEVEDPPTALLESYFLTLTNAYYFIAPKCEILGLYDDIAKSKAKIKYNTAYGDAQLESTANAKKSTVAELTISAEQASLDETTVSQIYSRSFKTVKSKLDAAETMISTISKIISSRMSENSINNTNVANKIGV